MLKIWFDDVLLDEDTYMSLSQKWVLFNNVFKLGSTMARQFIFKMPKGDLLIPNDIKIEYQGVTYANLIIDSYLLDEGTSVPTIEYTFVDKMILFNVNYNFENLVPIQINDLLTEFLALYDIELGNPEELLDLDYMVEFYDNTIQLRQWLSWIAEVNGGFFRFESDGKLYLRRFSNDGVLLGLQVDLSEKIKIGELHEIERVVYDNGIIKFETDEDEELETLYLSEDNPFINDDVIFNMVQEKILGFQYYNIDLGKTQIVPEMLVGDVIFVDYEGIQYPTIYNFESLSFNGGWIGSVGLNLDSKREMETQNIGIDKSVKMLRVIMNRTTNEISLISENVNGLDSNIAQLIINDSEIKSILESTVESLDGYSTISYSNELVETAMDGINNKYSKSGGNNLINNSSLILGSSGDFDYWYGTASTTTKNIALSESVNRNAIQLGEGNFQQIITNLDSGFVSLRFAINHIGSGGVPTLAYTIEDSVIDIIGMSL